MFAQQSEKIKRFLSANPLIESARETALELKMQTYLVGGSIRDAILGNDPKDFDFVILDRPDLFANRLAVKIKSRAILLGKPPRSSMRIQWRDGSVDVVSAKSSDIIYDLMQRDFSIDSIGLDITTWEIEDPTSGFADLKDKLIRRYGEEGFIEDPVRLLRAFRIMAELSGFRIEKKTFSSIRKLSRLIQDSAPERIRMEMDRIFLSGKCGEVFENLFRTDMLFHIYPEALQLHGLAQNEYHHRDVLGHTMLMLHYLDNYNDLCGKLGIDCTFDQEAVLVLKLTGWFHDFGKARMKTIDEKGLCHFIGHPLASKEIAESIMGRLRYSSRITERVSSLCLNHLRPLGLVKSNPAKTAFRRLIHNMGDNLPLLLILSYSDKMASYGRDYYENLSALSDLSRNLMKIYEEEGESLKKIPKLITGEEAMEVTGLNPGPELGRVLDLIIEKQVSGEIKTREEAVALLLEHMKK